MENEEECVVVEIEDVATPEPSKAKTLFDMYERDTNLEQTGIPIEYGPAGTFLVARAGGSNKRYGKTLEKRMKPYLNLIAQGLMDDDVALDIMIEVWVDTVIIGWTKVLGRNGMPLEYNRANAIQLFKDLPELFADLREKSSDSTNYRKEATELAAGN